MGSVKDEDSQHAVFSSLTFTISHLFLHRLNVRPKFFTRAGVGIKVRFFGFTAQFRLDLKQTVPINKQVQINLDSGDNGLTSHSHRLLLSNNTDRYGDADNTRAI